ncbi:MAG: Flp family type IVb pilin [Deltaproteobacteria bacterium]|nr:Flp family type IVb pilin [Deltaproteobacteria bacterium]
MRRRACGLAPIVSGNEEGQALAEYAMILLFVAVACVTVVSLLGTSIVGLYNGFNGSF